MSNVLNYFEQPGLDNDNALVLGGTVTFNNVDFNSIKLANVAASNDVAVVSSAQALPITGKNVIVGGTGYACTLAAPQPGALCEIIVRSISSGSVVVTTPTGVTFDGTNNTATFNAAADKLILGYASSTSWVVVDNVSVTLSSV